MPSRSSAPLPIPRALELIRTLVRGSGARRVVIDGRSGAGKTTLARDLAASWSGAQLLSLDEVYPGWGGLREGAALACALVLAPHAEGRRGGYRRFDWVEGTFTGPLIEIDPERPLVVEGCGALTATAAELADVSAWLDGDADRRRERALGRDGDGFAPYWEMWAEQEEAHIRREAPQVLAGLTLTTC